jgi:hypothetical protein
MFSFATRKIFFATRNLFLPPDPAVGLAIFAQSFRRHLALSCRQSKSLC